MGNDAQAIYWNEVAGPKWVKIGDEMDARFEAINQLLLESLAARPGLNVLDVGCGTGVTVRPLAEAVVPGGTVTGIDISAPMLDVARRRCGAQPNVAFRLADAQSHDFGAARYDLLASRFGVMFFDDPKAAFKNLHAALVPGGGLCFVCWAPLADNPHWRIPFEIAVARLGPPAEKPPHSPGPLAFSDPDYVRDILTEAGFSDIAIDIRPVPIIGASLADEARIAGILGPSGAFLDEKQASDEDRAKLRDLITTALRPFADAEGIRLPANVYLVRAKR